MISLRTKILTAATLVSGALVVAIGNSGLMGQQITPPNVPSKPAAVATPPKGPETSTGYIMPEMLRSRVQPPWEYKIVNNDFNSINEESLNKLGQDGWEFCTTVPGRMLFKRHRTNSAAAAAMPGMGMGMGGGGPGAAMMGGPGMTGGSGGKAGGGASIGGGPGAMMGMGGPGGSGGMKGGGAMGSPGGSGGNFGGEGSAGAGGMSMNFPGAPAPATAPRIHEEADSEETAIIPLKHAQASEMMRTITSLFVDRPRGPGMQGRSSDPKIAVDSRTNSLILIGQKRQLDKIRELIKQLDVETKKSRQDPDVAQPIPDPDEAQPIKE